MRVACRTRQAIGILDWGWRLPIFFYFLVFFRKIFSNNILDGMFSGNIPLVWRGANSIYVIIIGIKLLEQVLLFQNN
jgi:hypothetical protein